MSASPPKDSPRLLPIVAAMGLLIGLTVTAYAMHGLNFPPFRIETPGGVRRSVSPEIIAILLGVLLRNLMTLPPVVGGAARFVVRRILPATIVFMGAGLNLFDMQRIGLPALVVTLSSIIFATLAAYLIGQGLKLTPQSSLLIGAGTAICGNSAIVAVAPLVEAKDEDLVLSLGTINLFGLLVMLVLPLAGGFLQFGDEAFGVWAGVSVHAVPQAVAAGYAFSPAAGAVATLVKLVRVTLLTPVVIVLALVYARRHAGEANVREKTAVHFARLIPWYIWGFVVLSLVNTLGWLPELALTPDGWAASWWGGPKLAVSKLLTEVGKALLTLAMVAIGLEVNLKTLARVGLPAVLTGFLAAAGLVGFSWAAIRALLGPGG